MKAVLDPQAQLRHLAARVGALSLHARYGGEEITADMRRAGTAALNVRLLAEIDARDPGLPEAERQRRLAYARSAHFAALALKSAKARAKRKSRAPLHPKAEAARDGD